MQRRTFIQATATFTFGAVAAGSLPAFGGEELRLLTWEGYAENAWVKNFEAEHGVRLSKTYVGSNDEYMAKLAAGGGDYDLVVIVSSLARRAIDAGFVEPLDLSQIPNFENIFPRVKNVPFIAKDGQIYAAPTFLFVSPVTVNAKALPEGNDFGVLFDRKNAGRIAMWDDVSTLGDVANWMGIDDIWNMTDDQLAAVRAKLVEQKPLVRTYWSQQGEAMDLFANNEVIAANSSSYITKILKERGVPVREFLGKPPLGGIDSHFVVKGSPNRELAHRFINHILSAESQGSIADVTGYMPTNPASKAHMRPETWTELGLDDISREIDSMKFWDDIPRRARYIEVLNEVKAA
ncbi:PotD/PotF family extracellular solute-binding protein [Ensifer sp. BR816]|uniref:ABC transporter substrate-binding protein n=1 Tax=Rhizobium sp. (strain BR816) TaxID=1057002 RepID=UPI000376E56F|nr:extracellular solute-binding protein [Ensifer sp. BR816]